MGLNLLLLIIKQENGKSFAGSIHSQVLTMLFLKLTLNNVVIRVELRFRESELTSYYCWPKLLLIPTI
jgi:hypothetical protein